MRTVIKGNNFSIITQLKEMKKRNKIGCSHPFSDLKPTKMQMHQTKKSTN